MNRALASRGFAALVAAGTLGLGGCDEKVLIDIDNVAPDVEITSPTDGDNVSGVSFLVEITATDDVGVDRVEVEVGGVPGPVATTAPYRLLVVTLGLTAGNELALVVRAFDTSGNSSTASASLTVSGRTVTRLTNHPNSDRNPAWSPDGDRIVFQAKRDGDQFDLWTMDADGLNAARLTQNVNEDRNPAWSPDGEWIAFDSDRAGGFDLWRLPLTGGEAAAESLTFGNNSDVEPAWSPDGARLYFASDRGTIGDFNIWRVPAAGGNASQVTSLLQAERAPAISPDGATLAFVSPVGFNEPHVYTTAIGSQEFAPLTGDVGFTEADPAWAPVGRVVLYGRDDGVDSNVWALLVGDDTPLQATFGSGTLGDGGAAFSPDGSKIAFHSDRDGNLEIYVLE